MAYIDYYLLDKNNKVVAEYTIQACFYRIRNASDLHKESQYLLFDFKKGQAVSNEEAKDYFLFLKSIPEFKELMPRSCTAMAKTGKFKIDLYKFNGTKVFTILTLIRAVIEDPRIVHQVIAFDRKFKYSISNFSILKMCGSVHQSNSNHWITMTVDKGNLTKMFRNKEHWDSEIPCIKTGLGRNIFNTFTFADEGYGTHNPVRQTDIDKVNKEKEAPKKAAVRQKMYDTTYLQLGF